MEQIKDLVHYFKDSDKGIGLDLRPDIEIAIIFTNDKYFEESFATLSNNVSFVSVNPGRYENLKEKYPGLKLIEGNLLNTNLPDKCFGFIIVDSGIINYEKDSVRKELKRISAPGGWSDVVILEKEPQGKKRNALTDEFLNFLYAGSWYESKEFDCESKSVKVKTIVYHNPIGFNEEEFKAKEITEFIEACENYCLVIENYSKYSVKDFLYYVQKTLVKYYSKGFDLPDCCGNDDDTKINAELTKRDINAFFKQSNELGNFLGAHNAYWSNFDPFPDDEDKETTLSSLSNDIAEIYEDIKTNLTAFEKGNIYDKQQALWQFKFDWYGHTGDHWTFAVRAIHWKLQDLEYEE